MDTFFVSVERLLNPDLNGKPVVVGAASGNRGVVTAASYEVRALGVRSGMSMRDARMLAPNAIYLPTRHGVYSPYSGKVREILDRFTPVVRAASIDEFFMDFEGCEGLYRRPEDADGCAVIERTVRKICQDIKTELGLPASAGIGTNRAIAKMASGVAKPAGVRMVRAGQELAFVSPLPVRKFPGIGPVTEERMKAQGIHTLGELLALPTGPVREKFERMRAVVEECARGSTESDDGPERPAFLEHDPKGGMMGSISNERTFEDQRNGQVIEERLLGLCERVCWRARKRNIRARTFSLKVRYSNFETVTRSRTREATNVEADAFVCIRDLFRANWVPGRAVRLVGVQLSNLEPVPEVAAPAPDEKPAARPTGGKAIDTIRQRFGYDAIRVGSKGSTRWLE
jgi:DNA polymerase-4